MKLNFGGGNRNKKAGRLLFLVDDLMGEGGIKIKSFAVFERVFVLVGFDLDLAVQHKQKFFHTAFVVFAQGFAFRLNRDEQGRDFFLGTFRSQELNLHIFSVMRDLAVGLFGEMGDLFIAAVDSGIKFRESDAEGLGDFFMTFHGAHHRAGFDAGEGGLGHAGFLGNFDKREAFFLAKLADSGTEVFKHGRNYREQILIVKENMSELQWIASF